MATAKPETKRTAAELVAHLKETGTGPARVEIAEQFAKANPKATAMEAYEHLKDAGVALGTLRKAGAFATGDDAFEPPTVSLQTVDEVRDLREALAETRRQLQTKSVECKRLLTDNARLKKDLEYFKGKAGETAAAQSA